MKRVRGYDWHFYTQVKCNRLFNGVQLTHYRYDRYWHELGVLYGGIKVTMIKYHYKYFNNQKTSSHWREARNLYRFRQQIIEEVFKIIKGELCLCFFKDRKLHH